MTRRWVMLVAGLGIGLAVGLSIRSSGWLGGSRHSPRGGPPRASTGFVHRHSPAAAAKGILPGASWETVSDSTHETYLFGPSGRRPGARIRSCAIRNDINFPVRPAEQPALYQRLVDGIVADLQAESVEVFGVGAGQHNAINNPPRGTNPLSKPASQMFISGRVAYRATGLEGRVLVSLSGDGDGAVLVTVVVVEQRSDEPGVLLPGSD